ncbi:MAG: class II aldolase/adducin family protein [Alphaproteobacteria bacterium]|nr:class II aldolase/adducin family protein [Alphaproteobacteria bacterium]
MATAASRLDIPSVRDRVSADEWETRVNLAACYRLVALYGWTHLIQNHVSARVPGAEEHFLINPYGMLFREITASSLVKIDLDGRIVDETPYRVNEAGFVIHSAVHAARPDLHCVLHTHTEAGMAISALEDGLIPINQGAFRFYNRVGYHDYEGVALDLDERARIARDLGDHKVMVLRNHGLLTAGRTIAEAFVLMYHLEKTCKAQLLAMATGARLIQPPPETYEHAAQQFERGGRVTGTLDWPALLREADDADPGYRE